MPSVDSHVAVAGAPRKPLTEVQLYYRLGDRMFQEQTFQCKSSDVFSGVFVAAVKKQISTRFTLISRGFKFLTYERDGLRVTIFIDGMRSKPSNVSGLVEVQVQQPRGTAFPHYFGTGYYQYTRELVSEENLDIVVHTLTTAYQYTNVQKAGGLSFAPETHRIPMNAFMRALIDKKVARNQFLYHGSPVELKMGYTFGACYMTPNEAEAKAIAGPNGYVYKYRAKRTHILMLVMPSTTMNDGGALKFFDNFLSEEWESEQVQRLKPLLETDNLAHILQMYTPLYGVFYAKENVFHMFPPFTDSFTPVSESHAGVEMVLSKEELALRAVPEDPLEIVPQAIALRVDRVKAISPTAGVEARSLALLQMFNMYSPNIVADVDKFVEVVRILLNDGVDGQGRKLYYGEAFWVGNEATGRALARLPRIDFELANYVT
jgi:hypothetical protein